MDDESNTAVAVRYHRHGEAFWRELIARQAQSGVGVRKFCLANGVAPGTFHKQRATLREDQTSAAQESLSTADATFIAVSAIRADASKPLRAPRQTPPQMPVPRAHAAGSIIVTSGGLRIEMTGAHADRIVRHLLGRMNGFSC